jgi:hypothetical protein
MNISVLTAAALLLASFSAFGEGDERGNGGDAVVCRDQAGKIQKALLLDYYEAKELRKIPINLGQEGTFSQKIVHVLSRLERVAPRRAEKYREWFNTFFSEAELPSGIDLETIPDSNHVFVPHGCKVEQLAIRRNPERPEDKRYIINKDFWEKLSEDDKAGLVLHELIYREMSDLGEKDSVSSRYLNSILSSEAVEKLSLEDFISTMGEIGIPTAEWGKWTFNLKVEKVHFGGSPYYVSGTLYKTRQLRIDPENPTMIQVTGKIVLYKNGQIRNANLVDNGSTTVCFSHGKMYALVSGTPISFYEDGEIESYFPPATDELYLNGSNYHLSPRGLGALENSSTFVALASGGEVEICLQCVGTVEIQGKSLHVGVNPRSEYRNGSSPFEDSSYVIFPSVRRNSNQFIELFVTEPVNLPMLGRDTLFAANSQVEFSGDAPLRVKSGVLAEKTVIHVQGKDVYFIGPIVLSEDVSGEPVELGTLARDVELMDDSGKLQTYKCGGELSFFNGLVSDVKYSTNCQ